MTQKQILNKILARNPRILNLMNNLMNWDERKTLKENSVLINKTYLYTNLISLKYKLNYKKSNRGRKKGSNKNTSIKKLYESGLTISEISRLIDTSRQNVENHISRGV